MQVIDLTGLQDNPSPAAAPAGSAAEPSGCGEAGAGQPGLTADLQAAFIAGRLSGLFAPPAEEHEAGYSTDGDRAALTNEGVSTGSAALRSPRRWAAARSKWLIFAAGAACGMAATLWLCDGTRGGAHRLSAGKGQILA
jgi:hypothetical protein